MRKVRDDDPLFLNSTEEDALRKANAARVKTIRDAERAVGEQCLGALKLLAGCLASFLDVLYGSDEKERVVPILTSLLTNVTPYLRNHRYEHGFLRFDLDSRFEFFLDRSFPGRKN